MAVRRTAFQVDHLHLFPVLHRRMEHLGRAAANSSLFQDLHRRATLLVTGRFLSLSGQISTMTHWLVFFEQISFLCRCVARCHCRESNVASKLYSHTYNANLLHSSFRVFYTYIHCTFFSESLNPADRFHFPKEFLLNDFMSQPDDANTCTEIRCCLRESVSVSFEPLITFMFTEAINHCLVHTCVASKVSSPSREVLLCTV